ncbi:inner membrane protein YhjD [Acidothermaceae bacterium B102]|nr:inner membrane protein YhjD [Acidothermaceae bacterium B102]
MRNPFERPHAAVTGWLNALRRRWRWFDHVARATGRYQSLFGDRVAAGLTYYSFLSFFPLVAVAFSVVGYLIAIDPDIKSQVDQALRDNFAGLVGTGKGQINAGEVASAKTFTGVVGLVALLYTGLGWLGAVRSGLRVMWGLPASQQNFALRKLSDLVLLLAIGFSLLLSLTIAGFGSAYTGDLLDLLDLSGSTTNLITKVVAVVLGFLVDLPLFTLLFTGASEWRPRRRVLRGVMVASVGFEVLKLVGSLLLARTTGKAVYATFAVVVGLLVWMYLVNRVVLFAAAWTVTGPGDDGPTEPRGLRSGARARSSSNADDGDAAG